jgi:DMSO/TMAO reductase YedYZ molybdopterin-dependent catalytic subunit
LGVKLEIIVSDRPNLPPGQYESTGFPRFGLTQFAYRFPKNIEKVQITVSGEVQHSITVSELLFQLPRVEQVSDFHCVTTWSRRSLAWSGFRFSDFHESIVKPEAHPKTGANFVLLKGQDGACTSLPLEDILANDVLLADRLNGEPLSVEHGAPLRLIAPSHYGYKSIKHLQRVEFWLNDQKYKPSGFRFMQHPRARVAMEERATGAPGWVFRFLYRPLIRPTVSRFHRAMAEYDAQAKSRRQ